MYCVYMHTSPSGKSYIGQTCNRIRRFKPSQYKRSPVFYNAIQKYGWDNFTHIILCDNLSKSNADRWEINYINEYQTLSPLGYNIALGGSNGSTLSNKTSDELKARSLKLSIFNKGKKLSDDTKLKISITTTGVKKGPQSSQHIQKLSIIRKGKRCSDSCIAKQTESRKKPISCLGVVYPSQKDAAIALQVSSGTIRYRRKTQPIYYFYTAKKTDAV